MSSTNILTNIELFGIKSKLLTGSGKLTDTLKSKKITDKSEAKKKSKKSKKSKKTKKSKKKKSKHTKK